jgi:hypothetical protein
VAVSSKYSSARAPPQIFGTISCTLRHRHNPKRIRYSMKVFRRCSGNLFLSFNGTQSSHTTSWVKADPQSSSPLVS